MCIRDVLKLDAVLWNLPNTQNTGKLACSHACFSLAHWLSDTCSVSTCDIDFLASLAAPWTIQHIKTYMSQVEAPYVVRHNNHKDNANEGMHLQHARVDLESGAHDLKLSALLVTIYPVPLAFWARLRKMGFESHALFVHSPHSIIIALRHRLHPWVHLCIVRDQWIELSRLLCSSAGWRARTSTLLYLVLVISKLPLNVITLLLYYLHSCSDCSYVSTCQYWRSWLRTTKVCLVCLQESTMDDSLSQRARNMYTYFKTCISTTTCSRYYCQ